MKKKKKNKIYGNYQVLEKAMYDKIYSLDITDNLIDTIIKDYKIEGATKDQIINVLSINSEYDRNFISTDLIVSYVPLGTKERENMNLGFMLMKIFSEITFDTITPTMHRVQGIRTNYTYEPF